MDVMNQLRQLMRESGESRYSLAKKLNMSEGSLGDFMRGRIGASVERLEILADHFGYKLALIPKDSDDE